MSGGSNSTNDLINGFIVPLERQDLLYADGPGHCIYCLRLSNEVKLTDEHIISDGIRGNLVLKSASCEDCARIINRFENGVLNGNFRSARAYLGIRSRKRRGKKKKLPETYFESQGYEGNGPSVKHAISAKSLAYIATDLFLERPKILSNGSWISSEGRHAEISMINTFSFPKGRSISMEPFLGGLDKLVAKIAHSFAYMIYGTDQVEHYLDKFIISNNFLQNDYLVGRNGYANPQSAYLHRISSKIIEKHASQLPGLGGENRSLVVVEVSLFATFGTPIAEVVVGHLK